MFIFRKGIGLIHMVCIGVLLFTSCSSSKKVLYIQDGQDYKERQIDQNYEIKIAPDDLLSIWVNSSQPDLAQPFNLPTLSMQIGTMYSTQRVLGYQVDKEGYINFPVLGKIKVEGMTRSELAEYIKRHLIESEQITDPVITVQFLNFKISILGEVARPGSYDINSDRITIFEALGKAGDMTIYGRRDRIAVIREKDGVRSVTYHDLRSSEIFKSPYYYLQQNDIVYVEPNKIRAAQTNINQNNTANVWFSALSTVVSVVTLILTLK